MYLPLSRQRRQTGCSQLVDYRCRTTAAIKSVESVSRSPTSTEEDVVVDELLVPVVPDMINNAHSLRQCGCRGQSGPRRSFPHEKWWVRMCKLLNSAHYSCIMLGHVPALLFLILCRHNVGKPTPPHTDTKLFTRHIRTLDAQS